MICGQVWEPPHQLRARSQSRGLSPAHLCLGPFRAASKVKEGKNSDPFWTGEETTAPKVIEHAGAILEPRLPASRPA